MHPQPLIFQIPFQRCVQDVPRGVLRSLHVDTGFVFCLILFYFSYLKKITQIHLASVTKKQKHGDKNHHPPTTRITEYFGVQPSTLLNRKGNYPVCTILQPALLSCIIQSLYSPSLDVSTYQISWSYNSLVTHSFLTHIPPSIYPSIHHAPELAGAKETVVNSLSALLPLTVQWKRQGKSKSTFWGL